MKKITLVTILSAIMILISSIPALAVTTLSFSSTRLSVQQGEVFVLRLVLDPQDIKSYTAKMDLSFPADLLEIDSFAFASNWVGLPQPGYDLIDNTGGKFIKTGGFPAGVSAPVVFGTITFYVKSTGSGIVSLGNNSLVLNATNDDVFSSAPVQTVVSMTDSSVPFASEFNVPGQIPIGFTFDKDLRLGDYRIETAYLQLCLKNKFDLYRGDITGDFDGPTQVSVKDFQNRYFDGTLKPEGFSEEGTGLVDRSTRRSLNEICIREEKETPPVLFDITVEPTAAPTKGVSPFVVVVAVLLLAILAFIIYKRVNKMMVKKKIDRLSE